MTDYTEPENLLTPLKAVRAKCLDCCCGQQKEVRLCPSYHCALWPYRFGKRPTATLYSEKPPRYVAPLHLPDWDGGRIVSAEERQKSLASSGKTSIDGTPDTEPTNKGASGTVDHSMGDT